MIKRLLALLLFCPLLGFGQAAAINGATTVQFISGFGGSTGFNEQNPNMTAAQADCFFSTTNGSCATGNSIGLSWIRIQDNQVAGSAPDLPTLQLAVARGASVMLGFNPQSAITSGNFTSNANYDVAKIQYFQSNGVPIAEVSPINEPVNSGTTAANIDSFVATALWPAMNTAGLGSIPLTLPESANWFVTDYVTPCMNDTNCKPHLNAVSGHAYYYGAGSQGTDGFLGGFNCCVNYAANPLPSSTHGMGVFQTEVNGGATGPCPVLGNGNYDASMRPDALTWAHNIHDFQTVVFGGMWVFWNLNSNYSGCNDGITDTSFNPAKRFFAIGNWSRFVRPGWLEISATANPQTNVYITAFKGSSAFAIVAVNAVIPSNASAAAKSQTFNLTNLATSSVTPWITDSTRNLIQQSAVAVSGGSFTYTLPADSVTTFVGTISSGGGTINAASCSATDVQTAFNSVTSATTTVNIPGPCNVTWGPNVTVSLVQPSGSGTLTVQGQTSCTGTGHSGVNNIACTDSTVINDGNTLSNDIPMFTVSTATGGVVRVTGMTFTGTGSTQTYNGAMSFAGTGQFRADHNHIYNINSRTSNAFGTVTGVYDHNILSQASASILMGINGSTTNDWAGMNPWAQATNLGSANAIFFEDNQVTGGSTDCDRGGRWVFRFNTFIANTGTAQAMLTHPTGEPGGPLRGCRAWENYGNTFNANGNYVFSLWFLSAGTGVDWGNTLVSAGTKWDNYFTLVSELSSNTTYTQTATPNGWGYCGTAFCTANPGNSGCPSGASTPSSVWSQNQNTTHGYRCLDQPGTGKADQLTAGTATSAFSFPNIKDTVTNTITWPNQASEPIYAWLDAYPSGGNWVNTAYPNNFFQNVDYYLPCDSISNTGCTTFNGTVGVGSGVLASRPSTCTKGVGYWATDQGSWNQSGSGGQGELFICTATNTWSPLYGGNTSGQPYVYPHPLVAGSGISLTVSSVGTGTGTITGPSCATGNYPSGTTIGTCTASATGGSVLASLVGTGNASCSGTTCPSFGLTSTSTITATFTGVAATPVFSPVAGTYASGTSVTISTATSGCGPHIYWSNVHNPPTTGDTNSTSFTLLAGGTYYAAVLNCPGYTSSSAVGSVTYSLTAPLPPGLSGATIQGAGVKFQ